MSRRHSAAAIAVVLAGLLLGACQAQPRLATVPSVDLPRFMGDWYVIAAISASVAGRGSAETQRSPRQKTWACSVSS